MFFTILVWRFPDILNTPHTWRRLCVQLAMLRDAVAPDVAALCAAVLRIVFVCTLLAGAVGLLALLLANPAVLLALLGIVGYAWLTFPKAKV